MTKLRIAPGLALDADYIGGGTLALLAKKGAGKTYTGRVMAEEMWDAKVPFVVLDPMGAWWGLRSSANGELDGIPVAIFGGEHGDAPLERTGGKLMADLVVEEGLSMILDMQAFGTRAAERQFALDFLERLYRTNRELVHLFIDEADLFAPQKPQAGDQPLLGVTENIVRRGRNKGIGITLITQRSAVLNKDVLTQVDALVAMRMLSPQDRNAIDDWVRDHGDMETAREIKAALPHLANGECWWWIPELDVLKRVQVRESRTFDSSPTKKRGERRREPRSYADVDMSSIEAKMADTIERARAEDPKELRKQLAEARRELSRRPTETKVETVTETVEVQAVSPELVEQLAETVEELARVADRMVATTNEISGALAKVSSRRREPLSVARTAVARPAPGERTAAPRRERREAADGDVALKAGARRMLAALASLYPAWLTRAQVGTLAKVRHTGGTFGDYLSALRTAGAVEESGSGRSAELRITERGFELLGTDAPAPATPDELLAMWRDKLKRGARTMLDVLVESHPGWLSREELADAAEIEVSGGTFGDYLSTLRRTGLVEEDGRQVRAADTLFLGAA